MQTPKRGNPRRAPRRHRTPVQCRPVESTQPPAVTARLTLHDTDPITGNMDLLSSLFYESYRGYTIYSTEQGRCCIHGKKGCLRLRGLFASFPDIEDAKTLIKRFRAEGYTSYDRVERSLPEGAYRCLNRSEQQRPLLVSRPMQRVS